MIIPQDFQDIIEISFFTYAFYQSMSFLARSKKNNLLGYFTGYMATLFASSVLQYSAIFYFLVWYFPVLTIGFLIFHEERIQKNMIGLTKTTDASSIISWHLLIEILAKIGLHNLVNGRRSVFCIEQTQSLSTLLHSEFAVNTPCHFAAVTLMCDSNRYQENQALWIDHDGVLLGYNTVIRNFQLPPKELAKQTDLVDYYTSLTAHNDAIVFLSDPERNTWTIIISQTVFNHLSIHNALQLLKQHSLKGSTLSKGISYDIFSEKNMHQQHHT